MLGLPKGSLEESTKNLFAKAGWKIATSSRSYRPSIDDPELDGRFVRAQEVSRYVEHGFFDCGLTGLDWIRENESDVVEVCDLIYSKASTLKSRWVLCVPEASDVTRPEQLAGKRVATELVETTRRWFKSQGVECEVEFSWGATEVKVPELADAIVDITETGSSIKANKLRIVAQLMETTTVLVANKAAWADPAKRAKIAKRTRRFTFPVRSWKAIIQCRNSKPFFACFARFAVHPQCFGSRQPDLARGNPLKGFCIQPVFLNQDSRRQRKRSDGVRPWRRATDEIDAVVLCASSRIARFSSRVHERRVPATTIWGEIVGPDIARIQAFAPSALEVAVPIEDHHRVRTAIEDVDAVLAVDRDRGDIAELPAVGQLRPVLDHAITILAAA